MQRLASTDWMMAMVKEKLSSKKIDLHTLKLSDAAILDTNLETYADYLVGSSRMLHQAKILRKL